MSVKCDKCSEEFSWQDDFISLEGLRLCNKCRVGEVEYVAPHLTSYDYLPECPRGCDDTMSSQGEEDGDYWYCDECTALAYILVDE